MLKNASASMLWILCRLKTLPTLCNKYRTHHTTINDMRTYSGCVHEVQYPSGCVKRLPHQHPTPPPPPHPTKNIVYIWYVCVRIERLWFRWIARCMRCISNDTKARPLIHPFTHSSIHSLMHSFNSNLTRKYSYASPQREPNYNIFVEMGWTRPWSPQRSD